MFSKALQCFVCTDVGVPKCEMMASQCPGGVFRTECVGILLAIRFHLLCHEEPLPVCLILCQSKHSFGSCLLGPLGVVCRSPLHSSLEDPRAPSIPMAIHMPTLPVPLPGIGRYLYCLRLLRPALVLPAWTILPAVPCFGGLLLPLLARSVLLLGFPPLLCLEATLSRNARH